MRITKAALIATTLVLSVLLPALASAQTNSTYYTFNSPGTLYEASAANKSSSPYFWLKSGAELSIANGIGNTIQGALTTNDQWRKIYASSNLSSATDNGTQPQNVFLLLTKAAYKNTSAQIYVRRTADNMTNPVNRHPYSGESILARYQNDETFYYAGIRDDGAVVIKKKLNGVYQTLSQRQLLSGTYNVSSNPDLIPKNTWIGLRFTVQDTSAGPQLTLFTDIGKTGTWSQALSVVDDPAKFGSSIPNAGIVGIESDYADAQFDNFVFSEIAATSTSASTPTPTPTPTHAPTSTPISTPLPPIIITPTPTSTTTSTSTSTPTSTIPSPVSASTHGYDAAVLGDNPVMYLAMNSASSGKEADLSGHNNSGIYKGGTPASTPLPDGETVADFNGSSEYLTVPSNASLSIPTTGKLTWEAWIRPDTFQFLNASGDGYVDWMGKCANYSPTCEWEARLYDTSNPQDRPDRLSAYVFNPSAGLGSGADWQPQAGLLQAGQWLHVVAEYDMSATPSGCSSSYPGTINIWVNGIKQNFAAHAPTGCMSQYKIAPKAGSSPLIIGTMAFDTWFKGAVGKVAVYDRLLSQTEIDDHFTAMTGKVPSGSCASTCTTALLH